MLNSDTRSADGTSTIAVVIPFYQRQTGILSRALHSIAAQKLAAQTRLLVIIIDDGSPLRAADELQALRASFPHDIILLEQKNGGPGAARNSGIEEALRLEARFVAFLDSDDEWAPVHLESAMQALTRDASFYFCDHSRFENSPSMFSSLKTIPELMRNSAAGAGVSSGYILASSKQLTDGYLVEYLSQTSTVVYRLSAAPELRFDTSLRGAGEDHLFWIQLAILCNGAAISPAVNSHCGRGVNIYFGALDWSRREAADRYGYRLLFWLKLQKIIKLDHAQRFLVGHQARTMQKAYAYLTLRNLLLGMRPRIDLLLQVTRHNPAFPIIAPFIALLVSTNVSKEALSWQ